MDPWVASDLLAVLHNAALNMGVQIGSIVLKRPWTPIFFLLSLMKLPNTLLSLSVHVLELEYASRGRTQTERCQAPLSEPPFSLKSWSRGSSPVSSNSCFCKIPSSFPNYSQYKLVHHSQKQMCQYTFNLHLSFYAWGWASFLIFKCCSCFPWNSFFFFPLCIIYFHLSIFYLTYPVFCPHYSTVGSLQSVFLSHLLHYSLLIDSFIFLVGPC